jgi:hypothetical protein
MLLELLELLVPMSPDIVNIGGVTELGLYMLLPLYKISIFVFSTFDDGTVNVASPFCRFPVPSLLTPACMPAIFDPRGMIISKRTLPVGVGAVSPIMVGVRSLTFAVMVTSFMLLEIDDEIRATVLGPFMDIITQTLSRELGGGTPRRWHAEFDLPAYLREKKTSWAGFSTLGFFSDAATEAADRSTVQSKRAAIKVVISSSISAGSSSVRPISSRSSNR